MFPEYVEKFNQQQQPIIPEQVPADTPELENSKPLLKDDDSKGDVKREVVPMDRRKERKQSIPTWMMLLLVSIFGLVMALPLLQL